MRVFVTRIMSTIHNTYNIKLKSKISCHANGYDIDVCETQVHEQLKEVEQ